MKLGKNIANARKEQKLSQEELGEKIGVSRQTISNWECGETMPTSEQIVMLSKTFTITTDELLGLDNKDILAQRVIKTEKMIKKQVKFSKILFTIIYILVLILLLGVAIYCFTLKDFTKDYQEGISCYIDDSKYNISISPGILKKYNKETKRFESYNYDNSDYPWKMYVEKRDKNSEESDYQLEFSAGYSYKEAMESIQLLKRNIIKRGGVCR